MVVITNRGTANAAEVLAGALLDNKRAEVVGERTYGDAAMRKPREHGRRQRHHPFRGQVSIRPAAKPSRMSA